MADSVWQSLAERAGLSQQVQECLLASGYTTISSVSAIQDIGVIENFFQKKHALFSCEQRKQLYGIYATAPEQFEFLPGHIDAVQAFIQLCKKNIQSVKRRKHCEGLKIKRLKEKVNAQPMPSSSQVVTSCEGDTSENIPSDVSMQTNMQHSLPDEGIATSATSAPLSNVLIDLHKKSPIELKVYKDLEKKITTWCENNSIPEIQYLKLGIHYQLLVWYKQSVSQTDLQVKCEAEDNEGIPGDLDYRSGDLLASMMCLMCGSNILLPPRRHSYVISNATRHLSMCIKKTLAKDVDGSLVFALQSDSDTKNASLPVADNADSNDHNMTTMFENAQCVVVYAVDENSNDNDKVLFDGKIKKKY